MTCLRLNFGPEDGDGVFLRIAGSTCRCTRRYNPGEQRAHGREDLKSHMICCLLLAAGLISNAMRKRLCSASETGRLNKRLQGFWGCCSLFIVSLGMAVDISSASLQNVANSVVQSLRRQWALVRGRGVALNLSLRVFSDLSRGFHMDRILGTAQCTGSNRIDVSLLLPAQRRRKIYPSKRSDLYFRILWDLKNRR